MNILAAALNTPVSVMETAGKAAHGAWHFSPPIWFTKKTAKRYTKGLSIERTAIENM